MSPLEERWEAIEEAERAYRDTVKRVATDNIALARLRDGAELIRIGAPLRPEFAAWRYGDQFGRRRRKQLLIGGGLVTAAAGVFVAGPMMGLAIGGGGGMVLNMFNVGNAMYQRFAPSARVLDGTGRVLSLSNIDLRKARLTLRGEQQVVHVEFPYREWSPTGPLLTSVGITNRPNASRSEPARLEGDVALRALAIMLPRINGGGGSAAQVSSAVDVVEANGHAVQTIVRKAVSAAPFFSAITGAPTGRLNYMPRHFRLALEMLVHEDDERRAFEGELHTLEQRWKDAEEIAAIADSLTLPDGIGERVNDLRK